MYIYIYIYRERYHSISNGIIHCNYNVMSYYISLGEDDGRAAYMTIVHVISININRTIITYTIYIYIYIMIYL